MNNISNLASVHPGAKLGDGITIGPFVYVEDNVEIADGCYIRPHASILSGTRLGKGCTVYEGAVVGATPQDFRWDGSETFVVIDEDTTIREQVIINRGINPGGSTHIGAHSFIMAQTHIGHDSSIGNHCVLGNAVKIAGDCEVGDHSIMSSSSMVHEGCRVGQWVLVKGGCRINSNVPPYVVVAHNPVVYYGVNATVLRYNGFNEDQIDNIAKCYRHIYQCSTSVFNAMRRIREDVEGPESKAILDFIDAHKRKIVGISHLVEQ